VRRVVRKEPVLAVRGAALRTLAALGGSDACEAVIGYLDDPKPLVRQGAMVGLLRSGGIEGVLAAGQQLLRMVESPQPSEREMAAQVLGEVGVGGYYQPLVPLLRDRDGRVRRSALMAAGQIKNVQLWPLVIEKLASPAERRVAAAALVAGGESALPPVTAAFDWEEQPPEVRAQLARACGRIGGEQATACLVGHMAHPDDGVRSEVLRGLHCCGYQAPPEEAPLVQDQIRAETALSAGTLALQVGVGDGDAWALLHAALGERLAHSRARLFFLLSFLYDRRVVLQARDNLSLPSAEKRAYALEVLDVLLSPDLKAQVFPLLSDSAPAQKLQQLKPEYPQPHWDRTRCLEEIMIAAPGRFSTWTRACALYAVARLPAPALRERVIAAQSAAEPLVRETATWALRHLDGVESDCQEETMLTTIEKVIALKQASIFASTPDETLAAIAPYLEETLLQAGETIIEKGDLGDSMYLIVTGRVRVHDEEHTLNHLAAGEVFGEMAVLDAEPRMASVTAVEDAQLLCLAQEPLHEVMEDRSEVGRGLVRVLSQHLREVTSDLSQARARLEALEGSP
jgi:HEAT repeat protein